MSEHDEGYLAFRVGREDDDMSEVKEYSLLPPLGYHMNVQLGVVRVWDKYNTFVVKVSDLIALRLPNSCLQGR